MQSYHILTEVLCHDKIQQNEMNGTSLEGKCLCQMKDKEIRLILSLSITETKKSILSHNLTEIKIDNL